MSDLTEIKNLLKTLLKSEVPKGKKNDTKSKFLNNQSKLNEVNLIDKVYKETSKKDENKIKSLPKFVQKIRSNEEIINDKQFQHDFLNDEYLRFMAVNGKIIEDKDAGHPEIYNRYFNLKKKLNTTKNEILDMKKENKLLEKKINDLEKDQGNVSEQIRKKYKEAYFPSINPYAEEILLKKDQELFDLGLDGDGLNNLLRQNGYGIFKLK
jgi:hypothetical protein